VTIPSAATIINSTHSATADSTCYWVCPGDTLHLSGSGNAVFCESYSAIILHSGSGNTLVLKDSTYVLLDSAASDCIVWLNPGTVNGNSYCGPASYNLCPSAITFDYSEAPVSGCFTSVGSHVAETLVLRPNPAQQRVRLIGVGPGAHPVQIISPDGRVVRTGSSVDGWIDITGLSAGTYLVRLVHSDRIGGCGKLIVGSHVNF
jgi:hypothetical protein